MATYTLTGSGVQALTSGTGSLRVNVSVPPTTHGVGRAHPDNWYDIGLLRPMNDIDAYPPVPIDAQDMLLPLPGDVDHLGYVVFGGGTIIVVEVIGPSPFSGPAGPTGPSGATGATGATGPAGSSGTAALIASSVVTGSASSGITFSSIPNTYSTLWLLWTARQTGSGRTTVNIRFNNDSAANYWSQEYWGGQATGGETLSRSFLILGWMCGSDAPSGAAYVGSVHIPAYAGTVLHKGIVATNGGQAVAGDNYAMSGSGNWLSTAAINRIDLIPAANQFAIGSSFYLYAI